MTTSHDVCFKVETHNHPSAIDPYGGANTGLGGVIRDALGTGLGAKPICNTDVFCVAPPDLPPDAGSRRRASPQARAQGGRRRRRAITATGWGFPRSTGPWPSTRATWPIPWSSAEPWACCRAACRRSASWPGDRIVAIGGRTGRDGIHGATFSSAELTGESDAVSGGAVQIGNAITEKMVLDVIIQARDRQLFHAITDCGAGGFSSAVGEMGAELGAVGRSRSRSAQVPGAILYRDLDLRGPGANGAGRPTREMAGTQANYATARGSRPPTWASSSTRAGSRSDYQGQLVADLSMSFLHEGRPAVVREATWTPPEDRPVQLPARRDFTADLLALARALGCLQQGMDRPPVRP